MHSWLCLSRCVFVDEGGFATTITADDLVRINKLIETVEQPFHLQTEMAREKKELTKTLVSPRVNSQRHAHAPVSKICPFVAPTTRPDTEHTMGNYHSHVRPAPPRGDSHTLYRDAGDREVATAALNDLGFIDYWGRRKAFKAAKREEARERVREIPVSCAEVDVEDGWCALGHSAM